MNKIDEKAKLDKKLNLAFIIMAAGQSSRLGQAKQLVKYQEQSLLTRQISLCGANASNVFCVLGYQAETMLNNINSVKPNYTQQPVITPIINEHWQQGLGTSIACAIKNLPENFDAAMILLVDQWQLTQADIVKIIAHWQLSPTKIIACSADFGTTFSPPIIFPRIYFEQLKKLSGDDGARNVIKNNRMNLSLVEIPHAFIDLDTPEQLKIFYQQTQ